MKNVIGLLLAEVQELDRLGVIYKIDEPNLTMYLVIPRDLSKDNIRDNIERIKSLGMRVFSKVKGVDEYYNVNGEKLDRNKPLTDLQKLDYAREFLDESDFCNKDMMNDKNRKAGMKLFSLVTKEELEEIRETIEMLNVLRSFK